MVDLGFPESAAAGRIHVPTKAEDSLTKLKSRVVEELLT